MYSCGPTVYHFAHIGNMRSFLMADVLRRVLAYNGYDVVHVKNITDVGHLRDEVGESGGDRIEVAAKASGQSPYEVAAYYTNQYLQDESRLNMQEPAHRPRATDYIAPMIALASQLIDSGYAYESNGSVYFSVDKYERYGELSGNRLVDLVAGQRVDIEPGKHHPADFALWKAGDPGRLMNWESPWGMGFPGWHIECSVMATALLGEHIDIHTGGIDNLFPHHEDERAQSEAAFGEPFARYWLHGAHLLFGDEKMSKSLGNIETLSELIDRGIHPLALRYFLMQGHYRKQLSMSDEALIAAQTGLDRMWDQVAELWQSDPGELEDARLAFSERFAAAVNEDLGTPRALALVQEVLESRLSPASKLDVLQDMDGILGLDLTEMAQARSTLSDEQRTLVASRQAARDSKEWARSDDLREQLAAVGVDVRDTPAGQRWNRRR
jgi:cysteinyl-tRNA synthetase